MRFPRLAAVAAALLALAAVGAKLLGSAAVAASPWNDAQGQTPRATNVAQRSGLAPIPAWLLARYQAALPLMQPAVRAWAEQQARTERARPSFDLAGLESAIHRRFDGRQGVGASAALSNGDAAELAVIVILMLVQDGDQDLQQQMQNAYAMMNEKQAIRNEQDILNNLLAERESLLQTASNIENPQNDTELSVVVHIKP
jgi:hypothetical protein